jgi:hypothetical protein
MGLFDKKKNADFGSPVEQIDLSSQSGRLPAAGASPVVPEPNPVPHAAPQARYGIREAIELMRTLPAENVDLVVQVVKKTLESANIRIGGIIEDAGARQADIEGRISVLRQEISDLDREIISRKNEISRLEADHHEVSLVKDRLLLAEKLSAPHPAPAPTTPSAKTAAAAENTKASGIWPAGAIPTRASVEPSVLQPAPAQPAAQSGGGSGSNAPSKISLPGVPKR